MENLTPVQYIQNTIKQYTDTLAKNIKNGDANIRNLKAWNLGVSKCGRVQILFGGYATCFVLKDKAYILCHNEHPKYNTPLDKLCLSYGIEMKEDMPLGEALDRINPVGELREITQEAVDAHRHRLAGLNLDSDILYDYCNQSVFDEFWNLSRRLPEEESGKILFRQMGGIDRRDGHLFNVRALELADLVTPEAKA